jgi:hypothetical protein
MNLYAYLTAVACLALLIPLPRYVQTKLVGIDLLRSSAKTVEQALGTPERGNAPHGTALRYRDSQARAVLEFVFDDESGGIRSARVAQTGAQPTQPASTFRLPAALTEVSIRLGDTPESVERRLGSPHKKERGKGSRQDYLYRAPMPPDGSLPAYRARYTFVDGKLVGIAIALGE